MPNKLLIETEIVRKLAHSGLKTLGSLSDLFEIYDLDSKGGLHDLETRKLFHRSLQALAQAIRDLRLLAICEDSSAAAPSPINWKKLFQEGLSGRYAEALAITLVDGNYEGHGYPDLINAALVNMSWFAKRFWQTPVKVRIELKEKGSEPWVVSSWDYGNSIVVDSAFSNFEPYFPMFPKDSLALDKSTGLALFTTKRILELHGGTLKAQCTTDNLNLEMACPKSIGQKPMPGKEN